MSSYSSMLLCQTTFNLNSFPFSSPNKSLVVGLGLGLRNKKRATGGGGASSSSSLVPNAKERRKQSWWYKFFFDDDGNWLGLKEDDLEDNDGDGDGDDDLKILDGDSSSSSSSSSKFEAWKSRAEAITELRQAQEDLRNQEARSWEDWLSQDPGNGSGSGTHENENATQDWEWENGSIDPNPTPNPTEMLPQGGLVRSLRNFLLPTDDDDDDDDDDLLYEDRVLRYASINSAKFLVVLIIVPWALDFVFHDYVLMPFLDRYVKTVPLAAQMLDVRRNQKLEIVEELKMEKARVRLEVEIGKSPPLSEDHVWWELRHKALELREERRLHNRGAFANIASDMVFGISLFILLYCNQSKVALLKFTGYKLINNISDTGKAFLIILITDIFLGYHSESGWQTLLEIIVEHYGLEVDQSAITFFICLVPVIIDACVKLWLFKFLPRLSPKVATIFREMKRH